MADPAANKKKDEKENQAPVRAKTKSTKRKSGRLNNRSFRSSVSTAIRSLEGALAQKQEPEKIKSQLQQIYSIVDKGVKRGVFKPQKAARTKSRLSARCSKV